MIINDRGLSLSIFVEQGRERHTADFYVQVFGAEEITCYEMMRLLIIELRLGSIGIVICGSDPVREAAPSYTGPFSPSTPGQVSTIFQLAVDDVETAVETVLEAGGGLRDAIQVDLRDRQVASIFDPAGHVWVLVGPDRVSSGGEVVIEDEASTR